MAGDRAAQRRSNSYKKLSFVIVHIGLTNKTGRHTGEPQAQPVRRRVTGVSRRKEWGLQNHVKHMISQ